MRHAITVLLLAAATAISLPAMAEDAPKEAAAADAKPAEAPKDYTILKLGNDQIKNSEVQDIWKGLFPSGQAPDFNGFDENIRQNVLRGLVSERLIYQEAVKAGVDKSDEVKKRLAAAEKQIVMQTFMEDKAKTLVSDEELRKAYNEKVAANKGQEEVKARHILVASEDEAKKIAADLKKGGDFDKIAKEKSTDKGSGAKGGELGWFTKDKMVPEFADAAFKLKKGDISGPVKTAFGWHIIKVEDRRPLQMASFEQMKDSLRAEQTNKAVQNYVEGLLKSADIKYYSPDGSERPFSRSLSPAAGKPDSKEGQ
jgi:peptidyl-prolyl cis-trans isomerase C